MRPGDVYAGADRSGEWGTISVQPAAGQPSPAGLGYPSQPRASTRQDSGWFPVKKLVSKYIVRAGEGAVQE
jgi:hypothetical protein